MKVIGKIFFLFIYFCFCFSLKALNTTQPHVPSEQRTGAFAVLSLNQLRRLDHFSRIQYLELLQETLIEAEKMQNTFSFLNSRKNSIASPHSQPPEQNAFFWQWFYEEVYAAEASSQKKKFNRNLSNSSKSSDECIYGGSLSFYMPNKNAYGCQAPQCTDEIQRSWKNSYSQGNQFGKDYVLCSFSSFGIEWCTKPGIDSTRDCAKKAKTLTNQSSNQLNQILQKTFNQNWMKLTPEERLKNIDKLREYSFDPRVMSHLIKLAGDLQAKNVQLDTANKLKEFNDFDLKSQGVSALFLKIKDHCELELDESAIKSIQNEKGPRAQRRKKILDERKTKNLSLLTGTVLEKEECETLLGPYDDKQKKFLGGRYGELVKAYNGIISQYPKKVTPQPKPTVSYPSTNVPSPPPQPPPPTPPEPRPDPYKIVRSTATGCRSTGPLLINGGMRCAKCVAEKSRSDYDTGNYSSRDHGVSEKWLSLLTTMIYQCSAKGGRTPDPRDMTRQSLKFIQTFGHCSSQEYSWQGLNREEATLVLRWQIGRNLNFAASPSLWSSVKGQVDIFKKIYGISMDQAQELFCVSQGDSKKHMVDVYENKIRSGGFFTFDSSDDSSVGLRRCLDSIVQNLDSREPTECQALVANHPQNMQRAIDWAYQEKPVIAVDASGHCYVSHTTLTYADGLIEMIFADPKTGNSPRPVYQTNNRQGVWHYGGSSDRIAYISVGARGGIYDSQKGLCTSPDTQPSPTTRIPQPSSSPDRRTPGVQDNSTFKDSWGNK